MNAELSNAIKQAALEFWIDYNYEVAQGRKEGEEWLDEEEEEENSLYVGNCMKCSKKNDGDWDNNCEDPICIECGKIWKYNENDDSYYKIIKEE